MLPAGILAFMLPVEAEEGFYADPPIQRSEDCRGDPDATANHDIILTLLGA
jgi:hypothetical protein